MNAICLSRRRRLLLSGTALDGRYSMSQPLALLHFGGRGDTGGAIVRFMPGIVRTGFITIKILPKIILLFLM
jgi:hypothetical protein